MTITEALNIVKKDGEWTDENLDILSKAVEESDFDGYTDPELKKFMNYINEAPYHERIQDLVTTIVVKLMEKGADSPCGAGCGACAFHDMEFGSV